MTQHRIQLLTRFDHRDGRGTTTCYLPGDVGTFDEPLANALVYEGMGVAYHEPEPEAEPAPEPEAHGDAPAGKARKARKAAPENKSLA